MGEEREGFCIDGQRVHCLLREPELEVSYRRRCWRKLGGASSACQAMKVEKPDDNRVHVFPRDHTHGGRTMKTLARSLNSHKSTSFWFRSARNVRSI